MPVREAIKRLEADGLPIPSPQRATFAAETGLADMAGVHDVRQIPEVELARRAVTRADNAALKECEDAVASLGDERGDEGEDFSLTAEEHSVACQLVTNRCLSGSGHKQAWRQP